MIRPLLIPFAILAIAAVALVQGGLHDREASKAAGVPGATAAQRSALAEAESRHARGVEVDGTGVVARLLPDDRDGSRHQRFLVRTAGGPTVLIAHNIDLAPRVDVREGDAVSFRGEYAWNDKGGVVHWTHRDPQGRHERGWIEHNGRVVD
jgi:hypothetical protein